MVMWKGSQWLKKNIVRSVGKTELQEIINRCTDCPSIAEIMLKTAQILILRHQQQTAFENIVGKEEIGRYEQFLLFPQCFLLNQITVSTFVHVFDIRSLFAAELEVQKIGIGVKGLNIIKINQSTVLTSDCFIHASTEGGTKSVSRVWQ